MTLNPAHPPSSIAELSGLANRFSDLDRRMRVLETAATQSGPKIPAFAYGNASLTFNAQPQNEVWVTHNMNAFPIFVVQVEASNNLFWNIQYMGLLGYPTGNVARLAFEGVGGASVTGTVDFKWVAMVF